MMLFEWLFVVVFYIIVSWERWKEHDALEKALETKLAALQDNVSYQGRSLDWAYIRIWALAQYLGVEGSNIGEGYEYKKPKKVRKS